MLFVGCVPREFGQSFTVPILKNNPSVYSKSITVEDFRGITISPIIYKVLEHCILERYEKFFTSSDNQFGLKKSLVAVMPYTRSEMSLTATLRTVLQLIFVH